MNINRKQKQLIRVYVVIFTLIFIMMNWDNVSWMFNYKELSGLAYDFFNPYQNSSLLVKASTNPYSQKNNSIEIPKINISVPIVIGESTDVSVLEKNLDQGPVLYPESVLPGESGQTIILGHSAPVNWPHIKYDWVFSQIDNLNFGDEIKINFNDKQYIYRVIQRDIIYKGEEVNKTTLNGKNNMLILVSCWPPGKNYKRIAVQAELIKVIDNRK